VDQATLVENDVVLAARMLEALSRSAMPVSFFDWHYVPQLDEWQLVIATPWYDSKGPLRAWSVLLDALQRAGVYEQVPTRRVFLKSPDDPLVRALEQEARHQKQGFVHVMRGSAPSGGPQYSVIFAPITGGGGPVPAKHLANEAELASFLTDRLGLRKSAVEDALIEARRRGTSSIFPVHLSVRELKKAGLFAA
jgi:hypothetical protein